MKKQQFLRKALVKVVLPLVRQFLAHKVSLALLLEDKSVINMAAPPPQTFPYDYLFKILIIGDASVGKVR